MKIFVTGETLVFCNDKTNTVLYQAATTSYSTNYGISRVETAALAQDLYMVF
jgi:hypothetical protein